MAGSLPVAAVPARAESAVWAGSSVASPPLCSEWFAGTEAGNAIADVLFGDVNPGGKLPVTFPRHVGQLPLEGGSVRVTTREHAIARPDDDEKK